MIVKLLGHACVYARVENQNILMDPWLSNTLLGRFRRFPDPGPLDFDLPPPDLVLLSHHHWDHVHIPTLLRFDKTTPFLIPDNDQLCRILNRLGFQNIVIVQPWEKVEFEWGNIWPSRSLVPFGEVGYILETSDGVFWNLVDTVFSEAEIEKARELISSRIHLCLAPFQNFDEMGVIMRKGYSKTTNLARMNASHLAGLGADLILPFADGLYYPGNTSMNRMAFFHSPFEFIDEVHSFRSEQACMVPLPFDEFHFHQEKVSFQRSLSLDIQTILDLYEEYRSFRPEADSERLPDRVDELDVDMDQEKIIGDFRTLFENGKEVFFQQLEGNPQGKMVPVKELFRVEGMRWALDVEDGGRVLTIDFSSEPWEIIENQTAANCGLVIQKRDLAALLVSKELLSILTQSCSVSTWGDTHRRAYHSLNVLWYAGFDDCQRLDEYLGHFLKDAILNS